MSGKRSNRSTHLTHFDRQSEYVGGHEIPEANVLTGRRPTLRTASKSELTMSNSPIRILTITTLYPNSQQPAHGIFVENRLRWLTKDGRVEASVIAPVPWAPPIVRNPEFIKLRAIPRKESRHGFVVHHPRYAVIPKVGMSLTPYTLYQSIYRQFQKLVNAGERFDLIDAHYFYPDGVAAAMLGRKFGIPVVITARGTDINLIPQFPRPRQLILNAAEEAGALITVCQALKERAYRARRPGLKNNGLAKWGRS